MKGYVGDYYEWLHREIASEFGQTIPLTYNRGLHDTGLYGELAEYFNGVMGETPAEANTPENLYFAIHQDNNIRLNLATSSTLVDDSPLYNKRHIASVYALGGHPIVPYDVYIGPGKPRFYGDHNEFGPYYNLVREKAGLFDGHGILDVYIDHYQNTMGVIQQQEKLSGVSSRRNVMAVLKKNDSSSRVLHVVNWQVSRANMENGSHYFTFWIDKSLIPFNPTQVTIYRPNRPDIVAPVYEDTNNRWKVTISGVDVWAVAKFQ
ncbi:hypothetical protein GCM10007877_33090 [Marinibactrum halimedae]|uniref:Uncharacterized protein n=1 Tax=Marinibactrum halimedae TaxID=1444977 RepID=A0AA37WNI7_9GAMM|nr:hypothetical protein GCM10007877_33090 [Marinibactrum halimedae]